MARHRPTVKIVFEITKEGPNSFVCEVAEIRGAMALEDCAPSAIHRCAAIVVAQINEVLPKPKARKAKEAP